MIEQAEKQFITQKETLSTQSPEVNVGDGFSPVDTNRQTSLQPVEVQSSIQIPQEESVPTQSASSDMIITTGDEWNKAIQDKKPGVAPTVL